MGFPSTQTMTYPPHQTMSYSPAMNIPTINAPMSGPLPLPVVIPQQRLGSKDRGFMAAYAPSLEDCDIDRTTFLQFIDEYNTALKGNKYLSGVQVVAFGVGLTPEVIVMGVATAVQYGAMLANKAQVKHKTNSVLDKYNKEVFAPRGLYCMVMKYEPEQQDPSAFQSQSRSQSQGPLRMLSSLASSSSRGSTYMRDPVSGNAQGTNGLPKAVAPLMYMDDRRQHKEFLCASRQGADESGSSIRSPSPALSSSSTGKSSFMSKNKAKAAFDSFNDYLDRRARARYAAENENDVLNVPITQGFKNRYLDPNHPATNGGLIGLLSGGALSPDAETRKRKQYGRVEDEERQVLDQYHQQLDSIRNQNQSRHETDRQLRRCEDDYAPRLAAFADQRRKVETSDRHIKKDILYLMIVNLPSDAELASAASKLDREYGHGGMAMKDI